MVKSSVRSQASPRIASLQMSLVPCMMRLSCVKAHEKHSSLCPHRLLSLTGLAATVACSSYVRWFPTGCFGILLVVLIKRFNKVAHSYSVAPKLFGATTTHPQQLIQHQSKFTKPCQRDDILRSSFLFQRWRIHLWLVKYDGAGAPTSVEVEVAHSRRFLADVSLAT